MSSVEISHYPGMIARSALIAGQAPPDLDKPFTYAQFGCGDAATLLCLAASFPDCTFHGTDAEPDAQAMADAAGLTNLHFTAASEIPPCDYAVAHESGDAKLMSAAYAILTPGGLLQVITHDTGATLSAAEAAGLALMHGEQKYLALTFIKPGDEGFERGTFMMRGGDIVGFPEPARWSERVDQPEDPLSDFAAALDDKPLSLGPIMARGVGGEGPMEEVEAVAHMIAKAILSEGGLPYAGPALEQTLEAGDPIEASHPLTTLTLERPETYRAGCHLPSPVLGGGVALSPVNAAYLSAALKGETDAPTFARTLLPQNGHDPETDQRVFDTEWLPFLARLGVIRVRSA